jgi:hypothetical protein
MNWTLLGDGQHTIRVYDDGAQFAQAMFYVVTLGAEFLSGLSGVCVLQDFPHRGTTITLDWSESEQRFVIGSVDVGSGSSGGGGGGPLSSSSGGTSSGSSSGGTSSTSSGGSSSGGSSGGGTSSSSSGGSSSGGSSSGGSSSGGSSSGGPIDTTCHPGSGCCSFHGGVQGCTSVAVVCNDGQNSPTCTPP